MRWEDGGAIPVDYIPAVCRVLGSTTNQILPAGYRLPTTPTAAAA